MQERIFVWLMRLVTFLCRLARCFLTRKQYIEFLAWLGACAELWIQDERRADRWP